MITEADRPDWRFGPSGTRDALADEADPEISELERRKIVRERVANSTALT
jgi:hypothetical protein